MKVLVTGAAGFLGRRLIAALLQRGELASRDGSLRPIQGIYAFDMVEPAIAADERLTVITGNINDSELIAHLIDNEISSVFHLAAIVSGEAERDFDLGMRINVDATRLIMERIRRSAPGARFLITSSVAVFGGTMPVVVPDSQVWKPQSSYGTQKAINDLLLADYSRRGYLDGRSLRMPTIVVRPGKPNNAASSFASGIIREPLNGVEAVCPVSTDTLLWLMSPNQAIRNILHGHDLSAQVLGGDRVINMPGLSITVAEMLRALRIVAGDAAAERVRTQPDPAIEKIVNSWPGNFEAELALGLGFTADADFRSVIEAYMADMENAPVGRVAQG
jgi:nucleoside-diphosphate-sugar epimerase